VHIINEFKNQTAKKKSPSIALISDTSEQADHGRGVVVPQVVLRGRTPMRCILKDGFDNYYRLSNVNHSFKSEIVNKIQY